MRSFELCKCALALVVATLSATPCAAITARDVTEKMSGKEQYGYLTGLVDMLSYQTLLGGDEKQARCLSDAFYKDKDMPKRVLDALYQFPDKSPEGIVVLLMKQACAG